MESSPITDKTLGIPHNDWENEKFRDVKERANLEYKAKKTKRNRQEILPKYKPGDEFVATDGSYGKKKHYYLVKVIDFEIHSRDIEYYCILLKTTYHKKLERIGRLIFVKEGGWPLFSLIDAKVSPESIKWLQDI